MGPENRYEWEYDAEINGEEVKFTYDVWEYTEGGYNHHEIDAPGFAIKEEFGYDFSGGPEI